MSKSRVLLRLMPLACTPRFDGGGRRETRREEQGHRRATGLCIEPFRGPAPETEEGPFSCWSGSSWSTRKGNSEA